jgi:hypothetical protein
MLKVNVRMGVRIEARRQDESSISIKNLTLELKGR